MPISNYGLLASGSGASAFIDLTDVPSSYSGQGNKIVGVNAGATGLEFKAPSGTGTVTSVGLSSTDLSISGSPITTSGSITANINNSAVTTDKILDANVTADKLASNAVTTVKIADANVTLAKIEDIATNRILGRSTAGTGEIEVLTLSGARTLLNVEDGADVTDTANVITSLNNIASVAEGDVLYFNGTNWVRLARGNDGQVLTATATTINWENASSGFADPMTTEGDIIYRTSGGTTTRLARGTDGQVLTATADSINWETPNGGSESLASHTASTVSDDAITYGFGKTNYINGDAGVDFSLKIDESTITDGGTMDVLFYANGADRTVSYATIFTTKLGTSMTVASGDVAHYRIKKVGSVYYLYLNGVT